MINKVLLLGHVGAEPEVRTTQSGDSVANIRLATSHSYKDKDDNWKEITTWHTIIKWKPNAEQMAKIHKGTALFVEGRLETRKYQKKDGSTAYATEVKADALRIFHKQSGEDEEQSDSAVDSPEPSQGTKNAIAPIQSTLDDEVPF